MCLLLFTLNVSYFLLFVLACTIIYILVAKSHEGLAQGITSVSILRFKFGSFYEKMKLLAKGNNLLSYIHYLD